MNLFGAVMITLSSSMPHDVWKANKHTNKQIHRVGELGMFLVFGGI